MWQSVLWREEGPNFGSEMQNQIFPPPKSSKNIKPVEIWCGTRRTVARGGARFSAGLEFDGKFGIPQSATINESASYGLKRNRTREILLVIEVLDSYLERRFTSSGYAHVVGPG